MIDDRVLRIKEYVGDYIYGFTTKVKQNTLENQKQLLNKYINEK
ncbi:hypothetical protein [Romboutsia sp. MSSM.1001216sp_RTP31141st1_G3_RTP31141_220114]